MLLIFFKVISYGRHKRGRLCVFPTFSYKYSSGHIWFPKYRTNSLTNVLLSENVSWFFDSKRLSTTMSSILTKPKLDFIFSVLLTENILCSSNKVLSKFQGC